MRSFGAGIHMQTRRLLQRELALLGLATRVLLTSILLSAMATSSRAEAPDLAKLIAKWNAQRKSIRSARWTIVGTQVAPKGSLGGNLLLPENERARGVPGKDHQSATSTIWAFDLEKQKVRKELREELFSFDTGQFVPHHSVCVFDSSVCKHFFPAESNPPQGSKGADLGIVENGNTIEYLPCDQPVFFCMGIVLPSDMLAGTLSPEKRQLPAQVKGGMLTGLGESVIGARKCAVARLANPTEKDESDYDDVWIEPDSASILRVDCYRQRKLVVRTDWQYAEKSAPFPTGWTVTEYLRPGVVFRTSRLTVKDVQVNVDIPASEFDIELRPGMVVGKANALRISSGTERFVVAADGKTLVPLEPRRGRYWYWFLCPVLAVLTWVSYRRWGRRGREQVSPTHT